MISDQVWATQWGSASATASVSLTEGTWAIHVCAAATNPDNGNTGIALTPTIGRLKNSLSGSLVSGNSSQKCGGGLIMSAYEANVSSTTTFSVTAAKTSSTAMGMRVIVFAVKT